MKKKAASKARSKNLRAKTVTAKEATGVKGGGGKATDKSSPAFFKNSVTGVHYKKVTIE